MVNANVLIAVTAVGAGLYIQNGGLNNLRSSKNKNRHHKSSDKSDKKDDQLYLHELEITLDQDFGVEWKESKNDILFEEYDSVKRNKLKYYSIGTKTRYTPYVNRLRVFGGEEIRKYKIEYNDLLPEMKEEEVNKTNVKIGIKEEGELVKIDSKAEVVQKFNKKFKNKGFKLNERDLELIYYKPENYDTLVPMYQVGNPNSGVTKGDANVLGLIFPANDKYQNNFTLDKINYKRKVDTNTNVTQDEDGVEVKQESVEYVFNFESPNTNIKKINFIGNFRNVEKSERGPGKYIFTYQANQDAKKRDLDFVFVNYVNEYDISKTIKVKIEEIKNLKISTLKNPNPLVNLNSNKSRDNNEYGIEWGEDVIGGSCYSNYVNYMDTKAINNYKWTKPNAWVIDFLDKNNSGYDNFYVDDVDISTYIGHGNGYGFNLEGPSAYPFNGSLTYTEAAKGDAWGNRDLEYQVWLSCQVLEEVFDGLEWWQRWGPTFNGLHLICGFQTNASTGTHKQLKYFAENVYDDKKTVRSAWFDAADRDQPDGYQAVVMGPMIAKDSNPTTQNKQKSDYAAVNATTAGMLRAHWNDVAWNLAGPDKKDIPKEDITGWWRVVHTV